MKASDTGYLAAFVLALLPFFSLPGLFYTGINSKFFLIIAFADALLFIAAYRIYRHGPETITTGKRWFTGALLLVLLSQVGAASLGLFPARSLWSDIFWSSGVIYLAHLAAVTLLLGHLLTGRDWHLVRRAIAFSGGIFGALTLVGIGGAGATGKFLWIDLGNTGLSLGNETYAGAYLVLAFLIGSVEYVRTGPGRVRYALLSALVLIGLSPLLIGGFSGVASVFTHPAGILGTARASSAALFALLTFFAGFYLLRRYVASPWGVRAAWAWGALILAGSALALGLLFVPGSSVQEAYIKESTAARVIVWESSVRAVLDRPVFGWGPENFNFAIERNFDPRLFEEENLGEIWFEKAHNVFLDTMIGSGAVGLFAFLLLLIAALHVVLRALRKEVIGEGEAAILAAFPFAHLLQMQTGFDTIGSYALLAVLGAYLITLEKEGETRAFSLRFAPSAQKVVAVMLAALALLSLVTVVLGEYGRQAALNQSFDAKNPAQREDLARSLTRSSSFESLRLSSASFLKGAITLLAKDSSPATEAKILEVAHIYEERYRAYLDVAPEHYRARVNFAYLMLVETALGDDHIAETIALLEDSYRLSPGNPITPVLHAVALLYDKDLPGAERLMADTVAANPDTTFMRGAAAYFAKQKALYPNLTILTVTNL